jgi:hypothetical protein
MVAAIMVVPTRITVLGMTMVDITAGEDTDTDMAEP